MHATCLADLSPYHNIWDTRDWLRSLLGSGSGPGRALVLSFPALCHQDDCWIDLQVQVWCIAQCCLGCALSNIWLSNAAESSKEGC